MSDPSKAPVLPSDTSSFLCPGLKDPHSHSQVINTKATCCPTENSRPFSGRPSLTEWQPGCMGLRHSVCRSHTCIRNKATLLCSLMWAKERERGRGVSAPPAGINNSHSTAHHKPDCPARSRIPSAVRAERGRRGYITQHESARRLRNVYVAVRRCPGQARVTTK